MPKRTRAEIELDNIESFFDLIFNASSAMDNSSDLTAIKKKVLSDLSFKEKTKAATDFTLSEAVHMFGLKYVESPNEFQQNHEWNIERDMGKEEFPTTPCIGKIILLNHIIRD